MEKPTCPRCFYKGLDQPLATEIYHICRGVDKTDVGKWTKLVSI